MSSPALTARRAAAPRTALLRRARPARRRPRLAVLASALAVVLGACATAPHSDEPPPALAADVYSVVPVATGETVAPLDAQSRDAVAAGRYDEASRSYERLSHLGPAPEQRAEYLFRAAECALGGADHFRAYRLYSQLLVAYPSTSHFGQVVERVFLIGRLYAEGRAKKPSWLLGIAMSDREFGIQLLERFQKARERHELADDALHYVALAQLALSEPELAVAAWEKLVRDYPTSEWAQTAEYRAGLTILTLSAGARYDQGPLKAGLGRLRRYVERHPTGNHTEEARAEIRRVEEDLAAQQLAVARRYLGWSRGYSAEIYLASIQRDYPGTEAARDARALQARLPKSSPPPPKPEPRDLGDEDGVDRFRMAPSPHDEAW